MAAGCLVLAVAGWSAGCSDDDVARDDDGRITSSGEVAVFDLQPGDCLSPGEEITAEVEKVVAVPCAEAHTHEVFAVVEWDDGDTYPGDAALSDFGDAACVARWSDYFGSDYLDSALFHTYLLPTLRSWDERDDRSVICLGASAGEPLRGSSKDSGR
ncbi:MAG: septum formation family protein [Acidimicrobiia bacterium]